VVAIYTEHWHHVSVMRKILLRMRLSLGVRVR
jgi:hypothetical protein